MDELVAGIHVSKSKVNNPRYIYYLNAKIMHLPFYEQYPI